MSSIQLIALFNPDGSVNFDLLTEPQDVLTHNSELFPFGIHLHGKPGIVVSFLAENFEGPHMMTQEQLNRFRDALNIEIAKYGHRVLPPNSLSILSRDK